MQLSKIGLSILFVISLNHLFAQSKFNVTINIPSQLKLSKFEIYYNNGKKYEKIDSLLTYLLVISDSFYTKFAGIDIYYSVNESKRAKPFQTFYVGSKPAKITFFLAPHQNFSFNNVKLKNAINALDLGKREMDKYTANERKNYVDLANSDKLYDSLIAFKEYNIKLSMKHLEFIKKYPNQYYSLWCFRTMIAPSSYFNADSVSYIFKNFFDPDAQNSLDGIIIRQIIRGRSSTKIGDTLSLFTAEDIYHNKFIIGNKCDEYKLLVFWATWCGPCIAELPIIKEISDKYGDKNLTIFGFTVHDNIVKVKKMQEKYDINWRIIFNDENAPDLLGITGTPETILIDINGKIVYRSDELGDYDQMIILKEYLRKTFE